MISSDDEVKQHESISNIIGDSPKKDQERKPKGIVPYQKRVSRNH